jgi:hypothetical protein
LARFSLPLPSRSSVSVVLSTDEMLWVDKYRPTQLDKLDFHDDLTTQLKRIASPEAVGNMSHLMFYGPSGAGKKTRVMALLREVSAMPLGTGFDCYLVSFAHCTLASCGGLSLSEGGRTPFFRKATWPICHTTMCISMFGHRLMFLRLFCCAPALQIYGAGVEKMKVEVRNFKFKSSVSCPSNILSQHFLLAPRRLFLCPTTYAQPTRNLLITRLLPSTERGAHVYR